MKVLHEDAKIGAISSLFEKVDTMNYTVIDNICKSLEDTRISTQNLKLMTRKYELRKDECEKLRQEHQRLMKEKEKTNNY